MSSANQTGKTSSSDDFASSSGQPMTDASWLDLHFEAYRPEYEAALLAAEFEPGWNVLDAGCGGGSFLPLIADQIGSTGSIAACDLASENVEMVSHQVIETPLVCPVDVEVGSITQLPYPDGRFDGVWVGSVLMYLSDREMRTALAECYRVLRPGGVLAVKETDPGLLRLYPADPMVCMRLVDAEYERLASDRKNGVGNMMSGWFRSRDLRRWMERSGFVDVRQHYSAIERWAPVNDVERQFFTSTLDFLSELSEGVDLSEGDKKFWRDQRDPDSPAHLLNQPDFFFGQGQVVAIGRVPHISKGK